MLLFIFVFLNCMQANWLIHICLPKLKAVGVNARKLQKDKT